MTTNVDTYFTDGCGRCPLGGTPECKVNTWLKELQQLRNLIVSCGLTEEIKWGIPCYTFNKRNILVLAAFKEYCSISFFKGVLLHDTENILTKPGENSQSAKLLKITNTAQISKLKASIKAYIYEAIEIEKAELKVNFKKITEQAIPIELQNKLSEMPHLKTAFNALTPGRQRGYLIHFSQPKQSKTREARIEKCIPQILQGKGFHDY